MSDTPLRTIVKTLSWQGLGLLSMTGIGYLVTGSFGAGGSIAAISCAVGAACYVVHERAWDRVAWGRSIPRN